MGETGKAILGDSQGLQMEHSAMMILTDIGTAQVGQIHEIPGSTPQKR